MDFVGPLHFELAMALVRAISLCTFLMYLEPCIVYNLLNK